MSHYQTLKLKSSDKVIKELSKSRKFRIVLDKAKPINQPGSGNVFNELVKNIAYQQISYKAADTVYKKFVSIIEREDYSPKQILLKDYEHLKSAGFSYRKTDYIANIANFFEDRKLYKFDWTKLKDQEIIDLLSQIKGVGIWTVIGDVKDGYYRGQTIHEEMHKLYQTQDFNKSIALCQELKRHFGQQMNDYYDMWIERCEYMKTQDLPKDWNGVFIATTK